MDENPSLNFQQQASPQQRPSSAAIEAVGKLDEINSLIRQQNVSHNQDHDLGLVRYHQFLGMWKPIVITIKQGSIGGNPQALLAPLSQFCQNFHYPDEWANAPPSVDQTSGQKGPKVNDQTSHQAGNSTRNPSPPQPMQNVLPPNMEWENSLPVNNGVGNSASSVGQSGYHPAQPGLSAPPRGNTRGNRRVIALAPRTTKRSVQPGYTSQGERICFIQPLGVYRARFVVESSEGNRRLVESSAAGGLTALEGAKRMNIPETIRDEASILNMRSRVMSGGDYGLTFVAVGECDMSKKRMPFMVVGFYHIPIGSNQPDEAAISRSNLGKILAPREAERLIVEGITGDAEMSLKEALMCQTSPASEQQQAPFMGQPRPLSLPYKQQEPMWWFQQSNSAQQPEHRPEFMASQPQFSQQGYYGQQAGQQPGLMAHQPQFPHQIQQPVYMQQPQFSQQPFYHQPQYPPQQAYMPSQAQYSDPRPFFMQPNPIMAPQKPLTSANHGFPMTPMAQTVESDLESEL